MLDPFDVSLDAGLHLLRGSICNSGSEVFPGGLRGGLLGFRPGGDGIRDGLPSLEVLLEGEPVPHLVRERDRRVTEALHALLLENLDGGDCALERGDNVLQDGVSHAHNALDDFLEDAGRAEELRRLADEFAEGFHNLLEDAGEEVGHGFQRVHYFLDGGHRALVLLQ